MTPAVCLFVVFGCCFAVSTAPAGAPPEVRQYQVNFTAKPVEIDGVVDDIWDNAAPAAGDWRLLRQASTDVDAYNNRFRMLWDSENLYILAETDFDFWFPDPGTPAPIAVDFGIDNVNLYIDPNTDGEENFPPENGQDLPYDAVDGYQIAFNQYEGSFGCGGASDPCTDQISGQGGPTFGTFMEAHVDTLFGNQANWLGMRGTQIAQVNAVLEGGVSELAIPWTDFDADAEIDDGAGGVITTGLNHPMAPQDGDVWFFQAAEITSDLNNNLPVWNWTASQFFASHPHGEITFVGPAGFEADFNADGKVDGDDFLLWQNGFGIATGATKTDGDFDNDEDVDGDDFLGWQAEFGAGVEGAGSSAVPEPATCTLLLLATCCGLLRRRRRS